MNIMNHLVSLIIPLYNTEKYIAEALDSVLCQIFTDWECIVIDDHSIDNSVRIVQEYCNKYPDKIKLYTNPRKGACAARNYGTELAKGKFLKYLDADDALYDENVLQKQLDFIVQGDYDIVSGDEYYYNNTFEESNLIKKRTTFIDSAFSSTFFNNFPITSNFFIKEDIAKKYGWDEKLLAGQEYFLLYQCFIDKINFGYQEESILKIRWHHSPYRISNGISEEKINSALYGINKMIDKIEERRTQDDKLLFELWKKDILSNLCICVRLCYFSKSRQFINLTRKRIRISFTDNIFILCIYKTSKFSGVLTFLLYRLYRLFGIKEL
jgi:glycosyltransferase involved in cell wall biosynthesis